MGFFGNLQHIGKHNLIANLAELGLLKLALWLLSLLRATTQWTDASSNPPQEMHFGDQNYVYLWYVSDQWELLACLFWGVFFFPAL